LLTFLFELLFGVGWMFAQDRPPLEKGPVSDPPIAAERSSPNLSDPVSVCTAKRAGIAALILRIPGPAITDDSTWIAALRRASYRPLSRPASDASLNKIETNASRQVTEYPDRKFHWKPALIQSGIFLGLQHAFRFTEKKTRDELGGPFFRDWKESVKNLRGWDDGGRIFTNYFAHPLQGSLTSRIFINNSGIANQQEFGWKKDYWISRLKASVWSAAWSLQFEIGPISEASLGNVGQKLHSDGRSKLTYIDIVVTPIMGTGMAIAEDAVDKYILKNWIEKKVRNKVIVRIFRSTLTPIISFANLIRGRVPWWRDFRYN